MPYVPLGIDVRDAVCTDGEAVQKLHQEFGEQIILAVGRLVPYKGFDILIRAMKNVKARLLLVGDGPQYDSLMRLAASEGVDTTITMLRRVEDVRPYFSAAAFFVLPSVTRAEAFGIVQLEAMAAGLPVINTNIDSGVPGVCIDGRMGITVPARYKCAIRGYAVALGRRTSSSPVRRGCQSYGQHRIYRRSDGCADVVGIFGGAWG